MPFLKLHWLLQFSFCSPKVVLVLSAVGIELSSQTHCPSPSLLSYLHLHDRCSALYTGLLLAFSIKCCSWLLMLNKGKFQYISVIWTGILSSVLFYITTSTYF